MSVAG